MIVCKCSIVPEDLLFVCREFVNFAQHYNFLSMPMKHVINVDMRQFIFHFKSNFIQYNEILLSFSQLLFNRFESHAIFSEPVMGKRRYI